MWVRMWLCGIVSMLLCVDERPVVVMNAISHWQLACGAPHLGHDGVLANRSKTNSLRKRNGRRH